MLLHDTQNYTIHQYQVGQLQANCYFLVYNSTQETWIIDPGDEGDFLSEEILRLELQPAKIIFTHGHFDHVGGTLPLKLNFAPDLFLHANDLKIYQNAAHSAEFWQNLALDPLPPIDQEFSLTKNQTLSFSSSTSSSVTDSAHTTWQIIPTPGHTPGSIALYSSAENLLFTGDTLFAGDIGRTDFSYSSPQKILTSLQTLISLPPQTIIFPGHGEITAIANELSQYQ